MELGALGEGNFYNKALKNRGLGPLRLLSHSVQRRDEIDTGHQGRIFI